MHTYLTLTLGRKWEGGGGGGGGGDGTKEWSLGMWQIICSGGVVLAVKKQIFWALVSVTGACHTIISFSK